MLKIRIVLVLFLLGSLGLFLLDLRLIDSTSKIVDVFALLTALVCPFVFLAALIMLIATLLRIEKTADGMLAYDPNSFMWSIMENIFRWRGQVTICKAFWSLVVGLIVVFACLLVIIMIPVALYHIIFNFGKFYLLLIVMGGILLSSFLAFVLWDLRNQYKGWKNFKATLLGVGSMLITSLWLFWFPVCVIFFESNVSFVTAVLKWALTIVLAVLVCGVMMGVFIGFVFVMNWLEERWESKSLLNYGSKSVKSDWCPLLVHKKNGTPVNRKILA